LLGNWPDGRIKLMVTQRLLHLRRNHPEFFRRASYGPVESTGMFSESVVAFVRENEGKFLFVLATRLSSRIGFPATAERWKDTAVKIPDSMPMENMREIFSERPIRSGDRMLNLADAMSELPFAIYTNL
jgi:(1->4)-alpha-D-glucan 1-alpha-D-glucosylmutase